MSQTRRPPRFAGRVPEGRPLVMGIVNRTRDSFFDRGRTFAEVDALAAVDQAVADCADIGGIRAGAQGEPVDAAEEARQVVPFVAEVRVLLDRLVNEFVQCLDRQIGPDLAQQRR